MKKLSLIFAIFFTTVTFSQSKLNNYKYILVPAQFEFQRSPDIHQINSLTKFLFNKAGFTTYLINESFPNDLAKNRCNALTTRMINSPTFLSTRVTIELVDCNNNVVFTTRQGKSRLKDYRQAYNEAIRAAFRDIENANYHYKPIKIQNNIVAKPIKKEVVKKQVVQKITPKVAVQQKVAKKKEAVAVAVNKFELAGKYQIGDYGICTLTKNSDNFKMLSGDENFEIAKVYKTSKPGIFIIKWVAFKQPQLLQLTQQGNLKIDTKKGVREYKLVN
ncbi:hypothetical protein [Lutibacter sp.]|uniref:hypothetical protein n=1 Tax=Lutibacter sp. TaxID=1925666 RepID=UPI0025BECC35|nr:hypothetical protein [Lutibacter sp.]MCF6180784.1 hypothetical protein [Lutibacter sp.]